MDGVFRALADPTRRALLDRLHERNGQTLTELCASAGMTRQSVTQHLGVLEDANLVSTTRRGREKLHYLNPVPLHEIQDRWIEKFERPRLRALSELRRRAEARARPDLSTSPTSRPAPSGVAGPDRPRAHRGLLGAQQRVDRLAGGRPLGPRPHRRSGETDGGGTVEESATRRAGSC